MSFSGFCLLLQSQSDKESELLSRNPTRPCTVVCSIVRFRPPLAKMCRPVRAAGMMSVGGGKNVPIVLGMWPVSQVDGKKRQSLPILRLLSPSITCIQTQGDRQKWGESIRHASHSQSRHPKWKDPTLEGCRSKPRILPHIPPVAQAAKLWHGKIKIQKDIKIAIFQEISGL